MIKIIYHGSNVGVAEPILKVNPFYSQICICSEYGISKLKYLDSEVSKYEGQ